MSRLGPYSDEVQANVWRARPSNRHKTEQWLEHLGVGFVDVWFFHPKGHVQWLLRPQVDDPKTLCECLRIEMGRSGARCALWHGLDRWNLLLRGSDTIRTYPNREAAEMVAIHRG